MEVLYMHVSQGRAHDCAGRNRANGNLFSELIQGD